MKTLTQMTDRHDAISRRLEEILTELSVTPDPRTRAGELGQEIADLLREALTLGVDIQNQTHIAQTLLNQRCSGPH